eukprot:763234-Hanusia_phi.AAC.3
MRVEARPEVLSLSIPGPTSEGSSQRGTTSSSGDLKLPEVIQPKDRISMLVRQDYRVDCLDLLRLQTHALSS